MTEENYEYRTSQIMLRNELPGDGKWSIPIIPKFQIRDGDFDDLLLIGFDRAKTDDEKHRNRMVHFFLYDYKFERVWKQPDFDLEKLSGYRAVLSPDFSMYLEMNPTMQLYNTFRNRWCGAYWASKGIRVIPTINWCDVSSFDFCFCGVEKGSTVAVSTYMASAHNNHADQKAWFMKGYNEMLKRIQPEKVICYHTPFPEMEGDIIYVDYELSSWKYMSFESSTSKDDLECYKIGGNKSAQYDIIAPYQIGKGGGSVYGGEWEPSKPEDYRLVGKPGDINVTYAKDGTKIETKIGNDGRAVAERHHTSSPNPKYHSNPHDHKINWETPRYGSPNFEKPHINYWPGDYPDGAPEFKMYGDAIMKHLHNSVEDNRFKTISEFKECILRGGEPVFTWKGIVYGVCFSTAGYCIAREDGSFEKMCSTPDDVLEYIVSGDRLRDIITKVTVHSRNV